MHDVCAAQRRFGKRRTAYTTVVPYNYNTIGLQLPTVFSTITSCTGL